jgi:hypothetical protein
MASNGSGDNTSKAAAVPSELRLTHKWDKAIESLVVKASLGTLVAGLFSLVLFRKSSSDL